MKNQFFALLLALSFLTGCAGKRPEDPAVQPAASLPPETVSVPETVLETAAPETAPQETPAQGEISFDYKPGSMDIYVMADPGVAADPEALDDLTMTLPEGMTRVRVSDRQFDFVKNGMQVGGFLLVEFPEGILEKAAETREDFDAMSDYLAKQTMSGAYPSESRLWGGGHVPGRDYYAITFVNKPLGQSLFAQYRHHIYIGETYCYDFWLDEAWWGDSGMGVMERLSADDIKPELNEVTFLWDVETD